jgi:hypothetical protein
MNERLQVTAVSRTLPVDPQVVKPCVLYVFFNREPTAEEFLNLAETLSARLEDQA